MKYCSHCGTEVIRQIPAGDNRERSVCPACRTIHYVNPRIIVGCLAQWQDALVLCRRAIEPRLGYWTLPAGFLENGESPEQGASRESLEEACIEVRQLALFSVLSVPHINQVHMMYRAELPSSYCAAGPESLEVGLFTEQEIPWNDLAFQTVRLSLEYFFRDRRSGNFQVHSKCLSAQPRSSGS